MADSDRCQVDRCLATPNRNRHDHPCTDLRQAGIRCFCGEKLWRICYGGGLPATIRCGGCGAGILIEPLLRKAGTAASAIRGL
jgi:hypothetical protein